MTPNVVSEYQILRVQSPEAAERWRRPFAEAYVRIFGDEPYFERFTVEEAERIFNRLTNTLGNITLLALTPGGEIAGFGVAVPMRYKADVARELAGLVPVQHAYYLAELGVLPQHRHKGLGQQLVVERVKRIDRQKVTHVVLRVAEGQSASKRMYEAMGFEDMGVYMEVPNPRTDGTVRADRRLFMAKVLSQVDLE